MEISRHDLILKCIVDYFIKTATPVGSHTLIDKYKLTYSSATIRNEMMALEQQGLIEKTHTSSGRVPSARGYRYYIDHLRNKDVDEELKHQLSRIMQAKTKSVEDVIKDSCRILSDMTNLASVVLGPDADQESLLSVQVIPLSKNSATAVFVTDKGYVENKTFILEADTDIHDVQKCVQIINDRIKGTPIASLIEKMEAVRPLIENYVKSHDVIYRTFLEAFVKFASERVSLFGTENLLDQPEFSSDIEKLKQMVKLIESPERVREMFNASEDQEFLIGRDEEGKGMKDVSFLTKKVSFGKDHEGTIALVGPTRMDYEMVMNALEYVAQQLDVFFHEQEDKESER